MFERDCYLTDLFLFIIFHFSVTILNFFKREHALAALQNTESTKVHRIGIPNECFKGKQEEGGTSICITYSQMFLYRITMVSGYRLPRGIPGQQHRPGKFLGNNTKGPTSSIYQHCVLTWFLTQ